MTRLLVVSNPSSGSADRERREEIASVLGSLGEVSVCEPPSLDDFDSTVGEAAAGVDEVVVVGGDGTFNLAVNALEARLAELVFALIPTGTGNDLAGALGLPADPLDAARRIAGAPERVIDTGLAQSADVRRLFTNGCMGGFPVAVDEAIDADTKRRLGPVAFLVGGVKAAADLERSLVRLNDFELPDCVAAGVGNGRTAGGGIELWPSAALEDGLLNGCALGAPTAAAAAKLAAMVKRGTHERLEEVATVVAPRIRIEADPPLDVNCDGELIGLRTPATFEVAGRLRLRA